VYRFAGHGDVETPIPVGDEDAPDRRDTLGVVWRVETPIPVGDEDAHQRRAALDLEPELRLPSPSVTRTHAIQILATEP